MKTWAWQGLTMAGALVAGYVGAGIRASESAAPERASGAPVLAAPARSQAGVTRDLLARLDELERAQTLRGAAEDATDDEGAEHARRLIEAPAREPSADDEQRLAAHYDALEERFSEQGLDRAFRAQHEAELDQLFRGALKMIGRQRVECRADMCRTTIDHAGPFEGDLVRAALTARSPFEHHVRYEQGRTTIYSLRQEPTVER